MSWRWLICGASTGKQSFSKVPDMVDEDAGKDDESNSDHEEVADGGANDDSGEDCSASHADEEIFCEHCNQVFKDRREEMRMGLAKLAAQMRDAHKAELQREVSNVRANTFGLVDVEKSEARAVEAEGRAAQAEAAAHAASTRASAAEARAAAAETATAQATASEASVRRAGDERVSTAAERVAALEAHAAAMMNQAVAQAEAAMEANVEIKNAEAQGLVLKHEVALLEIELANAVEHAARVSERHKDEAAEARVARKQASHSDSKAEQLTSDLEQARADVKRLEGKVEAEARAASFAKEEAEQAKQELATNCASIDQLHQMKAQLDDAQREEVRLRQASAIADKAVRDLTLKLVEAEEFMLHAKARIEQLEAESEMDLALRGDIIARRKLGRAVDDQALKEMARSISGAEAMQEEALAAKREQARAAEGTTARARC